LLEKKKGNKKQPKCVKFKIDISELEDVQKIGKADLIEKCCCKNKNGKMCKTAIKFWKDCEASKKVIDSVRKFYCKRHSKDIDGLNGLTVKVNANKISALKLATQVTKQLDKHPELLDAECIILENQPGLTNPIMKRMQSFIYQHFVVRGIIDRETAGKKVAIKNILCMNATNKLKVYDGPPTKTYEELKNAMSRRKKIGIDHVNYFLKKYDASDEWVDLFTGPKTDDLADAYLYCLYQNREILMSGNGSESGSVEK